jgi:acetyl-CoA acetyltransferase
VSVAILGIGQTRFTGANDISLTALGAEASRNAVQDAGIDLNDIEVVIASSAFEHPGVGQRVLLGLGLNGLPLVNLENACASSTAAVVEGVRWIESGAADVALIIGVEKMATRFSQGPLELVDTSDPFGAQGVTVPALFGLLAEMHMHNHGSTREDFARIALKNRTYAAHNPNARFRKPPSLEEVLAQPMIATPIGKLDCCANGDGAAACILASETAVRRFGGARAVWIRAAEIGGGVLGDRLFDDPMTGLGQRAYERAGLGPTDIQVVECHDNFSVGELECYERLGFATEGEGHHFLRAGRSRIGGEVAFNPSGGLLGRSHPAGATGCAQVASVVTQLRGEAGPVQQQGAKAGMVQTSGGGVMELQSNATSILIVSV